MSKIENLIWPCSKQFGEGQYIIAFCPEQKFMVKVITSTKSYRNEYFSMDTSASVSGGFKGFSASASAAYGEVNNFVTSSQDDRHTEWGKMTTYNPLDYQIEREVTTRVQIT